jgi:hypothetical protein
MTDLKTNGGRKDVNWRSLQRLVSQSPVIPETLPGGVEDQDREKDR